MLGINTKRTLINTKRTLIKDGFARKIRDKVQRIQTGQLNEQDREEIRKNRRIIQNISVVWK